MATKTSAPHLCLELDIAADIAAVWRALTDLHELRAWWGVPVVNLRPGMGGGMELAYVASERVDLFEFSAWRERELIAGLWSYSLMHGCVEEIFELAALGARVQVTARQSGFESFGTAAVAVFGYHRTELRARLYRLQQWCEQRIPASHATMPAF